MIDLPCEIILNIINHYITDVVRQNEVLNVSVQESLAQTQKMLNAISALSVQWANCVMECWRKRKKRIKCEMILTRFLQNHIDQLHSDVSIDGDLYELEFLDGKSRYLHAFLLSHEFGGRCFAQYKVVTPYISDAKCIQWVFDLI